MLPDSNGPPMLPERQQWSIDVLHSQDPARPGIPF
jgi:hypothetical protein